MEIPAKRGSLDELVRPVPEVQTAIPDKRVQPVALVPLDRRDLLARLDPQGKPDALDPPDKPVKRATLGKPDPPDELVRPDPPAKRVQPDQPDPLGAPDPPGKRATLGKQVPQGELVRRDQPALQVTRVPQVEPGPLGQPDLLEIPGQWETLVEPDEPDERGQQDLPDSLDLDA